MRIRITSVDHEPPELKDQTPFEAELLRKIPGSDRPDYWLAELAKPIRWIRDGEEQAVTHIVLKARWLGTQIGPGIKSTPVGISYVVDGSVLDDDFLDSKKCIYVAIGMAEES